MRGTTSDTRCWHTRTPFGDLQQKRRKSAGSHPDVTTHREGVTMMVMERKIKRKRGKEIGTDLVLNPTNESARSLPGVGRLRGESCSRGRTLLLVDDGTLIPYSSPRSVCGCHGSFRHSCPSRWLHFWQSFSWIHGQTRLNFGGGGLDLSCTGTRE